MKSKIINACRDYEIGFIQAMVVRDNGVNMSFIDSSRFGSRKDFLNLEPQIFVTDGNHFTRPAVKTVDSLDEIPFYNSFRDTIDEYLANRKKRREKSS
jgi:hypothetical protein